MLELDRRGEASKRRLSIHRLFPGVLCAGVAFTVGCRSSSEYVEAELRFQTKRTDYLERICAGKDAEIQTLRATVCTYQNDPVARPSTAPETVYRNTAVSRITLGMATGGRDADQDGRDDGVQVSVLPVDYDGDALKCPGACRLLLFEIQPAGTKLAIGEWNFPPETLRTTWRSTLLGQGYQLVVPWDQTPREKKLRAVVTFATLDGRKLEVEKDFEVSLHRKQAPRTPNATLSLPTASTGASENAMPLQASESLQPLAPPEKVSTPQVVKPTPPEKLEEEQDVPVPPPPKTNQPLPEKPAERTTFKEVQAAPMAAPEQSVGDALLRTVEFRKNEGGTVAPAATPLPALTMRADALQLAGGAAGQGAGDSTFNGVPASALEPPPPAKMKIDMQQPPQTARPAADKQANTLAPPVPPSALADDDEPVVLPPSDEDQAKATSATPIQKKPAHAEQVVPARPVTAEPAAPNEHSAPVARVQLAPRDQLRRPIWRRFPTDGEADAPPPTKPSQPQPKKIAAPAPLKQSTASPAIDAPTAAAEPAAPAGSTANERPWGAKNWSELVRASAGGKPVTSTAAVDEQITPPPAAAKQR